jgi:uncharacterized membrane protein YbhN (UPF0104 family)
MSDAPAPLPLPRIPERARRWIRAVGLVVGLACFALAIHVAVREREEFAKAIDALRDPDPLAVAMVLLSVAVGAALSGLLFHLLMRRFGRVPFWEMEALISASAFANYLPLKPGFVGRVAYHRLRHGIRASHTLRTIVEAIALSGTVAGVFLLSLLALRALGAPGELALLAPALLAPAMRLPSVRGLSQALLVRQAELALWTLRYWAVFRLVGVPIDLETAIVLASVSVIATLLPIVSNGLGIREWVIGLLAPMISHEPVSTSQAIVAELVHRAAEIAVMTPLGVGAILYLVRLNRRRTLEAASGG